MSKQTSRPPSGRPRASQSADIPVNVPTSTTVRAPISDTSIDMKRPWSWPMFIPASPPNRSAGGRGQGFGDRVADRVGVRLDVVPEFL